MNLEQLLLLALESRASDLHLSSGEPPILRIDGELRRQGSEPLTPAAVRAMAQQLMSPQQQHDFEQRHELDFAYELPGRGDRFRVNAYEQRHGCSLALRVVPAHVNTLQELGAPRAVAELSLRSRGLVLVTGATGSGKSTTLAAMVDHRNRLRADHILTVEDPIEFRHESRSSLIHQREVGAHTRSFAEALRSALREDPDVILVGELRDLESIRLALTAAETGHLVLGTLHASSAPKAVDRLVDVFPQGEKELVRTMLSESLIGVVAQVLCRRRQGGGRIAAMEVMMGTPAIGNLIREGKVAQMYSVLQSGQAHGMQTLDQHLLELVRQGGVSASEARLHARFPDHFPA